MNPPPLPSCWVCGSPTTNTETGVCEDCGKPIDRALMEIKASYDHMKSIQTPECDKVEDARRGFGLPRGPAYGDLLKVAQNLERENQRLRAENQRLRQALSTSEDELTEEQKAHYAKIVQDALEAEYAKPKSEREPT